MTGPEDDPCITLCGHRKERAALSKIPKGLCHELPEQAVDEVARWMAAEVERTGYLSHDDAALKIWQERDFRFAHWSEELDGRGRSRPVRKLNPNILKAFKKLTSKTVVWEKDARAWRKRRSLPAQRRPVVAFARHLMLLSPMSWPERFNQDYCA